MEGCEGAEIKSDHNLVLMKVKLKMQTRQKTIERQTNQQIRIDRMNSKIMR